MTRPSPSPVTDDAALIARSRSFTENFAYDINMVRGVMRNMADRLEVAASDRVVLVETLRALVAKLDECEQPLRDVFTFYYAHGCVYNGPSFFDEREAARAALVPLAEEL